MTELLKCEFVKRKINGTIKIESSDKAEFINQFRSALKETKGVQGVVYVLKTVKNIPRVKGSSNILYIGETKGDAWNRYSVEDDVNNYWPVYSHIVNNYGEIFVDVYETSDHKTTEKKFLMEYYKKHNELPPINRKG